VGRLVTLLAVGQLSWAGVWVGRLVGLLVVGQVSWATVWVGRWVGVTDCCRSDVLGRWAEW